MRAKTINEIQNFEKGASPKSALGVGKVKEAKELLDYWYDGHHLVYNIKSLDHIEITYSPEVIERAKGGKNEDQIDKYKWIIKYVELDRFIYESHSDTISIHSDQKYHDWNIYERRFCGKPHETDSVCNKFCLSISKQINESKEKANIIIKSLNDFYGPIKGFELIESIKP
jgi:hypothetical protein